ncbi:HTH-type transcriptional repressor AllR [Aquimixticola soesokkakensis]|uniref:HTH-type transcriptional repressor AllR n=1 Tax=Aquimixticola soesokkakensis TaxID=1519096 RepID=A0A1Y5T3J4_9RHOB|nr:IclR family transcriptional regulator [Aquimixticola soesokkakensis]SLN54991.1 HTH-type transcriptional repressor AllR [Aquimixticola soesokkakensis]
MGSVVERTFAVLELLSTAPDGLSVSAIAEHLDMPASGTHRLLNQLVQSGYVSQDRTQGDYGLTMKAAAIGMSFLRRSKVVDIAQPVMDALAQSTHELVRLSVVDTNDLIWIGVAQGATMGLRYDPGEDQGVVAHLASSASGLVWLSTLPDDAALMRAAQQGFRIDTNGPNAPTGAGDLLQRLAETRARGFSMVVDCFMPGMNAMAAAIRHPDTDQSIGTLSVAGPSVRFVPERMEAHGAALMQAARELGKMAYASQFFRRALDPAAR